MIGLMPVRLDHAVEEKMLLVAALYRAFEEEAARFRFVCQAGCADCCTVNLQATSAEVRLFLRTIPRGEREELGSLVASLRGRRRLRPRVTPNGLAALLMAGREPPEEDEFVFEPCPFLDGARRCRVYPHRVFGCRSVFSLRPCREAGAAEMPPELFSLVTVLMQLLEEIDLAGLYGNFLDLLDFFLRLEAAPEEGLVVPDELLSNREAPDFAIPPAHEDYVRRFLARLYRVEVRPGQSFKALLDEVKDGAGVREALSFLGEAL